MHLRDNIVMDYEITATKKRPKIFDELVGQEFVVATLASSIKQNKIAHAYLFSGPRGVGKTSAARILAKSLNCENGPTDKPCGQCHSCSEITSGSSLDVIEIDGASNTSVNDVREIKDEVLFAPNYSRYKVYIIDEVHMLSNSAFNALLKTIEEPPPYIIFIFATTEIHKVPATIRSRCQQFNFRLISIEGLKKSLSRVIAENQLKADDEALFWIAKESTGSLRDAYTLLDQIISFSEGNISLSLIKEKLGIVGIDDLMDILGYVSNGQSQKVLDQTHAILSKGISIEQFTIDLTEFMRNILFLKHGISNESILGYSSSNFPMEIIDTFSVQQIEIAIELLLNLFRDLRYSLNPKFELELLMSKFSNLKKIITQSEIVTEINAIKKGILELSDSEIIHIDKSEQPSITPNENSSNPNIDILVEIIKSLHSNHKLTLASALEKAEFWKLQLNELVLTFDIKNKFQGEIVKKEKKELMEIASSILTNPIKLIIEFVDSTKNETDTKENDDRIETLKNIFNGDIIKGETDGH
jgi:DNA polymerase-3 subunit gamma/tau